MISRRLLWTLPLLITTPIQAYSSSCQGRGAVIFYGNGMFNSYEDAQESRIRLRRLLDQAPLVDSGKELRDDLAYKRSEGILEQLANVAVQKGVNEFEYFWLWLSSHAAAPDWFKAAMKSTTIELFKKGTLNFADLGSHFESYAKYIREGYNVILVSHSQGSLYANQAMRKLSQYTDGSLTGSIEKKGQINPLFPKFFDLFANVQVATPVSATIHDSPWSTFKDDWIMASVRDTVNALPANLKSPGMGLPPSGDLLGHDFIKAYLRIDESREKILSDIRAAYSKLRYPIAYFQPAFMIAHPHRQDEPGLADLSFEIREPTGKEYGGGHDEEWPSSDLQIKKDFTDCFDLKPGDSKITAETIVDDHDSYQFQYTAWPEGRLDPKKEKPVKVSFWAKRGSQRWDVGVVHVQAGTAKEPLDVRVEIYPQPRLRK